MGVRFLQFFSAGIISIVSFTSLSYAQQNPTLSQTASSPPGVSPNHTFSQAYRIGGPTTSVAPMPLVEPSIFPLFIEDNEISSLVTLINGSAVSSSAVLTIRDLQGKASPPVSIPVGAHAKVQIKVADLLQKAGAQIRVGSILVTQGPELKSPAIVGQLTLSAITAAPVALTEEELVMPMLVDSQDLRSISESATDAQLVAVTSMSAEVQHITAQCYKKGSIATKTATLAPGGVTLLYPCSKDSSQFEGISLLGASETSESAGISIHSDGPNGGFAAFGLARHLSPKTKGFLGSLQFIDPTSMHSSSLVFTGVSAGYSLTPGAYPYSAEVALANFSTEQSHVKIAVHKTDVNGIVSTTTTDISLAPQSSTHVPLGQLGTKTGEVGSVIVSSDQPPGDLMAKIVSSSDSAPNQLEQLAKDGLDERNGGAHPWTLQDSARSDLVLFNHSSHTEPFNIWITTEDGAQWNKSLQLAPFETRIVSINDLVRNKVADSHGRVLPATSWSGSVVWQTPVPGTGSGHVLIRNEANASGESFSCGMYSSICGGDFTPYTTTFTVGQTASFGDFEAEVCLGSSPGQCSGNFVGTGNDFSYFWQSDSPGVLSISGGYSNVINLYAASVGSSLIEGSVSDGSCGASMAQTATAVAPDNTPVITGINPSDWPADGMSHPVTFTGQYFGNNQPTLTFNPSSGIGYSLLSYNDTQIVANLTVSPSTPSENVSVSVTSTGYNGIGFMPGSGQNSPTSAPATALVNGIQVTLSPSTLSLSSGDTGVAVNVSTTPSTIASEEQITNALSSNPNSSSNATLSFTAPTSFSGNNDPWTISVGGNNSPSGIFTASASAFGANSHTITITVPPQVLIQVLYGEANGQPRNGDSVSEPAIGSSMRNRFGNSAFPGTPTTWQAVIIPTQYDGINTSTTTGVNPELNNAVALFTGTVGDIVGGSTCFFSPNAAAFAAIQNAYTTQATVVPTVANDPTCYGGNRQLVWKTSVGNNANGNGAPAFIFERPKTNSSDPAVVQIP